MATLVDATDDDVDKAVEVTQVAFNSWSHTDVKERSALLLEVADWIETKADFLSEVESLDNG